MIVIAGSVSIRPEKRAEAIRAALDMARATRAEPGCHAYRFSADLDDPNLMYIFEEWEDDAALARHFQTPHMAAFRKLLPAIVAAPGTITRYSVSAAGPM